MKRIIIHLYLVSFLVGSFSGRAQTSTKNYVKSTTARVPLTGAIGGLAPTHVNVDIAYFDDLGRPDQSLSKEASPSGKDIVSLVTYDNLGRQSKNYLPYEQNSTTGAFRTLWQSEIDGFYDTPLNSTVDEAQYYYSEVKYEPSPLNRSATVSQPGAQWVGSSKGITYNYEVNIVDENIFNFYVDNNGKAQVRSGTYYQTGELTKTIVRDEDLKTTIEYKNILGQIVCKRAYINESVFAANYFIFDEFGQLRFVIQPEGVAEIGGDPSKIDEISTKQKWVFEYRYDKRRRMIYKRVPGAAPVYMVYDQKDRLILVQDGNMRGDEVLNVGNTQYPTDFYEWKNYRIGSSGSVVLEQGFSYSASQGKTFRIGQNVFGTNGKWLFTKYDRLNRPVMTGIVELSGDRASIQAMVDGFDPNYVSFDEYYTESSGIRGYSNAAFPTSISDESVLTVTYYDKYDFASTWGTSYSGGGHNTNVRGMVTGGYTRQINASIFKFVTYYDNRLRPLININQHHLSGVDRFENEYYDVVSPNIKKTKRKHSSSYSSEFTITNDFTYDNRNRLKTNVQTIGTQSPVTIVSNNYNEIGQLYEKNLGGSAQSVDFKYNIRGWLQSINGGTSFDDGSDKFGMLLEYNTAGHLNGNIGKMTWKSIDDQSSTYDGDQNYVFAYDGLNRLKSANYYGKGNDYFTEAGSDTDGKIKYDLNGNILSLNRNYDGSGVDHLEYKYVGNQLNAVDDSWGNGDDQFDETYSEGKPTGEYLYDANGNMVKDANKGISQITYNHLNLPQTITLPGGTVTYSYDAKGVKLKSVETSGKVKHYLNGIHYEADAGQSQQIRFIQHSEGRARWNGSIFVYEYNLSDHLGNVRISVGSNGAVVQRDDYYPFGLTFNHWNEHPENLYKFQGQEEQTELGWIQFKWRNHDPALGRFFNIDPLADKYVHNSTYAFSENKVTAHVELEGLEAFSIHGTNSNPSTFDNLSDSDIQNLSGNQSVNRDFAWPEGTNGLSNDQADRTVAATALAEHVMGNLAEGEGITLIGHSHGGNVAIQAVDMILEALNEAGDGRSVNLITIATPAYNGADDPENPANTSAASHTQYYSESDAVQTTLANAVGSKTASRTYDNPGINNVRVNDTKTVKMADPLNPGMTKTTTIPQYGSIESHSIHQKPELLRQQ